MKTIIVTSKCNKQHMMYTNSFSNQKRKCLSRPGQFIQKKSFVSARAHTNNYLKEPIYFPPTEEKQEYTFCVIKIVGTHKMSPNLRAEFLSARFKQLGLNYRNTATAII